MQRVDLQPHEATPTSEIAQQTSPLVEGEEQEPLTSQEVLQSVEELSTILMKETKRFQWNFWGTIAVLSTLTGLVFSLNFHTLLPPNTIVPLVLSSYLVCSLFLALSVLRPRRRWRDATALLVKKMDMSTIGSLVEVLRVDDSQTRQVASLTLTQMLPRLKASDAHLLNEAQRTRLLNVINLPVESPLYKDIRTLFRPAHNDKIDFHVAILKALEQVGDSKALPVVEKLAKGNPKTEGEQRIKEAAQNCLLFLQQRVQQQVYSQTLLRPAGIGPDDAETLLRPAEGAPETDHETLLRPSHLEE